MPNQLPAVIFVGQPIEKWVDPRLKYDNHYPWIGFVATNGDEYVLFEALTEAAALEIQRTQSVPIVLRWRGLVLPPRHWISH